MTSLYVVCTLFISALSASTGDEWKQEITPNLDAIDHKPAFKNWQIEFNKQYEDIIEETHRYKIFVDNWQKVNNHNLYSNSSYTMKLNQFADLLPDEFQFYVHGHHGSCIKKDKLPQTIITDPIDVDMTAVPDSIDWTNINGKSYVTPVKNQGQCGSCWAFATTGNTESRHAIQYNLYDDNIVTLSEQQLVDCSTNGDSGCNGGYMNAAYDYVKSAGGLCSEQEYPYLGNDSNTCKASSCGTKYYPITKYTDAISDNEPAMLQTVAAGPTAICIEADQSAFQFYSGGVLDGTCGTNTDHCILTVGYGHDDVSGLDYWKVKNSWGTSWGMDGYVLICRNCGKNGKKGECGILMYPSYVTPQ